jgi:pSer/pThr/pTyr-binding forkhead associated (FHA) protein
MKEVDGATGVLHLSNGQQVVLGEYRLTLGRLPECTITFDDTNVSREHAEICPDDDGFVLTDLGSTNGTTVNGVAITSRRLDDGDIVSLGATTSFEFRAG